MQAHINSQDGSSMNVTFTFDDASTLTQDISAVPYFVNIVDPITNLPVTQAIDPAQNMVEFLRAYATAYLAGKIVENQTADQSLVGQTLTL